MSSRSFARHWGCRVSDAIRYCGLTAVVLENETLRVVVLPEKGAEIASFLYKPTDTDPLYHRGSLRTPPKYPATIYEGGTFTDSYSGGWQEIFPSGGGPSQLHGAPLGNHGEVFHLSWNWEVIEDRPKAVAVRFWVRTLRTPFLLERVMRLEGNRPLLTLEETVTNEGGEELPFMWGHHPAFGAPFLDGTCVLDVPAALVVVQKGEPTAANRLVPGSQGSWPLMTGRSGSPIDLRGIPAPDQPAVDMFYLTGLSRGWYALTSRGRGLGIACTWDTRVFPVLWVWQELCGSQGYPWYSQAYVLGLEPFTSYNIEPRTSMDSNPADNRHPRLQPGQQLHSGLCMLFYPASGEDGVSDVSPEGQVIYEKKE